ncbi:MAG: hypothetical protein JJU29_03470 [Verrucomicrobia bacterium]|nr:hypothetical protein [Verrucomicrobiota bacterium]
MHPRFALLAFVLLGLLPARPEVEPEEEPPPPTYDLTLVVYTWPVTGILHGDADLQGLPPVFVRDLNGMRRVGLQRSGFSPPLRYQGMEPPVLFRVETQDREEGPPRQRAVPLIRANIDPSWTEATVIVYPERRESDGTWATLAVPSSRMEIPDGASRFLNLTDQALVIEMAGNVHAIPPGGEILLPPPPRSAGDRFRLNIHARDDQRDDVRMIHTTAVWRENTAGNLYLIHAQANGRPRVLHLSHPRE